MTDGGWGGMGLHVRNGRVGSTFVYDCNAVGRSRLQSILCSIGRPSVSLTLSLAPRRALVFHPPWQPSSPRVVPGALPTPWKKCAGSAASAGRTTAPTPKRAHTRATRLTTQRPNERASATTTSFLTDGKEKLIYNIAQK